MTYKVLYRKYRPDKFENIIGQDYIITTLRNSIANNHISHAYIFSGPRGTGKTSTAKVFSKAINCLNPNNGSPCGECEFCKNFQENPDIIEIDAASNNGVDEIRALIDNVKLTPTNGKYKVYIIDEVHMLTTSAFNALLLTLEEPPAHTIFILATTNIENVPITILSRCQRFDFQKINIDDIVARLKDICKLENIQASDEALKEIGYLSEGGMRDALSLLDQLSKNKEEITLELIETQIKIISERAINELIDTIENNDVNACLAAINDYRLRAVDYKSLVKKFIDIASNKAKNIKKTGRYKRLNYEDYKKLVLDLIDSLSRVNINVDSYTILEMLLLEFFDVMEDSIKEDKPSEKKLEAKETPKEINTDNNAEPLSSEITEIDQDFVNIRINNCFVDAQKNYLEQAKRDFENLKNSVNIEGKIKTIILDSQVVAASSQNLIITCDNERKADNANKMFINIEDAIKKELNKEYKVVFLSGERWNEEKVKYIENLKNKKTYEYIDEKEPVEKEDLDINDVFDINKVEII